MHEFKPVSFASLMIQKLVVRAPGTAHYSVERHFLAHCMESFIETIYLDPKWYLDTYPDVKAALAKQRNGSAQEHYVRYGYFENRMPYRIKVDEAWYLANYADIGPALAKRLCASAQAHFEQVGFAEGRLPHAGFELRTQNNA